MHEALIWINFLIAGCFSLWRVTAIDLRRLTFADGLLVGQVYYLVVPMAFVLVDGSVSAQFIRAQPYQPFRDVETTLAIIVCLYFVSVMHVVFPRPAGAIERSSGQRKTDRMVLNTILVCYGAATLYGFLSSGLISGGHWYNSAHAAQSSNGTVLLARHLANFSRTAVFGGMIYLLAVEGISLRRFILIGALVGRFDLFLTFNRITAAYFLISLMFINRRNVVALVSLAFLLVVLIPFVSNAWPVFRGLATVSGYTFEGLLAAAQTSIRFAAVHASLAEYTSGVFETINIPVLNWVVQHRENIGIAPGTIYLRPASFFLPSMLWSDRPEVFATVLGGVINQSEGAALNSTLIGEPYANFGDWWPIAMLPMYFLYHWLFLRLTRHSGLFGGAAAFCGIALWRFDTTIAPITLALGATILIGVYVLAWFLRPVSGPSSAVRR